MKLNQILREKRKELALMNLLEQALRDHHREDAEYYALQCTFTGRRR